MIETHSYYGWGTGAIPLEPDSRDYEMHRIPRVARKMDPGLGELPSACSLQGMVGDVMQQGKLPACVAYSTAAMKAVHEMRELGRWLTFDAMTCYHDCGGDGRNGVPTRAVLQYAQDRGLPVLSSAERYRIGSYAFAPQDGWVDTLKAAIAAGQPCVIATLLPEQFGWESSGQATKAYHQMLLVGYDAEHAILLNSWGKEWGRDGFGRLRWDYLTANNFQGGLCYAYTAIDAIDEGLAPTPAPEPAPPPPPKPPPFQVSGYIGNIQQVPAVRSGALIQIVGDGFADGPMEMFFGYGAGGELKLEEIDTTQHRLIRGRAPAFAAPILGRVVLRRGDQREECGLMVITPNADAAPAPAPAPPPTPSGDLKVTLTHAIRARAGSQTPAMFVYASATDSSGEPVEGLCHLFVGGRRIGARSNSTPPSWVLLQVPASGTVVEVAATTMDGRAGSASFTMPKE